MSRMAVALMVLSALVFTCLGCQTFQEVYFNPVCFRGDDVMPKNPARSKCDMTIQTESGYRERFECESEEDFRVRAYQYCIQRWKYKGEFSNRLLDDLRVMLKKFSINGTSSFEICGLVFMQSIHFADGNSYSSKEE